MKPEAEIKKILKAILSQLKYFFINPFWISWQILIVVILALALNGWTWDLYLTKYKEMINVTPVIYASAVILLNLFLAAIYYPKEKIVSWILIGIGLLIQLFIIFFIKMSVFSGAY